MSAERGAEGTMLERLERLRAESLAAGGPERVAAQAARGKLTARERLTMLLDPGTFREIGQFVRSNDPSLRGTVTVGDGVITGYGQVAGRLVYVYSQDFTVMGGSLGKAHADKISRVLELAVQNGAPVVGLNDSGGARIQEGVSALAGYSSIFLRNTQASGIVPQISAIMGPCAGGAVYSPALTDFILMVQDTSYMFVTGPDVVRSVTHEEVTADRLGGAEVHSSISGVAHLRAQNDRECLELIRVLLGYLPQNNLDDPVYVPTSDDPRREDSSLDSLVPDSPSQPYDMRDVIIRVVDEGELLEIQPDYAGNVIIGFARLDGHSVGIVASQPMVLAGVLDIEASEKAARFVRTCDCFGIPLVVFEDVPGFMPGISQEHGGIIRAGAKLLYAFCEATVPRVTVITRKAYGGAYCVMNSLPIGGDLTLAWLTAELAVMGAEGAVDLLLRRELAALPEGERATYRAQAVARYREQFANPFDAAALGLVDDIIEPRTTRARLIDALASLRGKRSSRPARRHGNIPL